MSECTFYHDGNRELQDSFGSRALADRLEERLTRSAFTDDDRAFIESLPYFFLATHWWQWALLPVQWILGPLHGAIVNWGGHKYGYRNFDNGDASRNTLAFDVLTMGELFQNNHHKFGMSPNFAARRWELDPTWQVMKVLAKVRLIEIATPQRAVYPEPNAQVRAAA